MARTLTLGSLFDGSGGFPLAGLLAGIKPLWNSEVCPFPILVTQKRLPRVKHYGDVSKLKGGELEAVDIITFGSPCQDLSVAGKRAGIVEGKRSNLFFEALRIIKEMRDATGGEYPRYAVFENVAGIFSSNKGENFRLVLEEFCKVKRPEISIPKPQDKWLNAGEIVGDSFSLAWRVLDAQYFSVPQRRARIFLVADFRGWSAGKILFESEGLSGDFESCNFPWQRTAAGIEAGTGTASGLTIKQSAGFCTEHSAKARSIGYEEEKSPTLRAGVVPAVMAVENHPADSRVKIADDGKVQTLTERMGTGGGNTPMVLEQKAFGVCSKDSNSMMSDNPHSVFESYDVRFTSDGTKNARGHCYKTDISRCLDTGGENPDSNHGGICVLAFSANQRDEVRDLHDVSGSLQAQPGMKQQTFVLQGSMVGRKEENGPNGSGLNEDICFTLNTRDRHAVYCSSVGSFMHAEKEKANTLMARDYKDPQIINDYLVRRITPLECARLQGFPDWWCDDLAVPKPTEEELVFWMEVWKAWNDMNGKKPKTENQIRKWLASPYSDSEVYKLWGNGVALPCVFFVLSGIVLVKDA